MRLVTVTEDADDVRRRVRQSELESLGLDPGDVTEVLTRYGEARLLTFDRDPLAGDPPSKWPTKPCCATGSGSATGSTTAAKRSSSTAASAAHTEWAPPKRTTTTCSPGDGSPNAETWASRPQVTLTPEESRYLADSVAAARDRAETRRRRILRHPRPGSPPPPSSPWSSPPPPSSNGNKPPNRPNRPHNRPPKRKRPQASRASGDAGESNRPKWPVPDFWPTAERGP